MVLFPKFGTNPPAKVPTVGLASPVNGGSFRTCRNLRGPAGREFQRQAQPDDDLVQHIADLADAYAERIAIVVKAGDIGEAEARRIAETEIGWRFVEAFVSGEVPP